MDAERKKLVAKQQTELKAMEKDVKKKKGFLKDEAVKKFEALTLQFESELTEFDKKNGTAAAGGNAEKEKEAKPAAVVKIFEELDFPSMSKSELEEECGTRGLSKKGTKEQLITRLMIFTSEQKALAKTMNDDEIDAAIAASKPQPKQKSVPAKFAADPAPPQSAPAKKPAAKKPESDSEDESSEDDRPPAKPQPAVSKGKPAPAPAKKPAPKKAESSDDDDDDDDSDDMTEEEKAQAEKFAKREAVVQKSISKMLALNPEGVAVNEVALKLEEMGVKNFRPDVVGYKTLHEFFNAQPDALLRYEAGEQVIYPPGQVKPKQPKSSSSSSSSSNNPRGGGRNKGRK